MKILDEFKKFAMRGNVIDLAVGVVIGGAFGKIVSSLVADIIMPLIGLVAGGVNFTELKFTINDSSVNYGNFIQATFDFLIIAFSIFIMIKAINRVTTKKEKEKESAPPAPVAPPEDIRLLTEIRDLLQKNNSAK